MEENRIKLKEFFGNFESEVDPLEVKNGLTVTIGSIGTVVNVIHNHSGKRRRKPKDTTKASELDD